MKGMVGTRRAEVRSGKRLRYVPGTINSILRETQSIDLLSKRVSSVGETGIISFKGTCELAVSCQKTFLLLLLFLYYILLIPLNDQG